MGILKALAKKIKQGAKDTVKGKKSSSAGCFGCFSVGCFGVIIIVILLIMGIVGALQSVYDVVMDLWGSVKEGMYMEKASDEERYLDIYFSVSDFENLTAYQYNFLFTNEHAREQHADLLNNIEKYFDEALMSYDAFKDFCAVVSNFEDYRDYAACLRYLPVITRQYTPEEFADILESFTVSDAPYKYWESANGNDYVNLHTAFADYDDVLAGKITKEEAGLTDTEMALLKGYRDAISTLKSSGSDGKISSALNAVYRFFNEFNVEYYGSVSAVTTTSRQVMFGYLTTVEDDKYNWDFSDSRYSNIYDEFGNLQDTPTKESLEYESGYVVYTLSAGKVEDSAWLSEETYTYDYGASWQHVYAAYVYWAIENDVLENPEPEEEETEEQAAEEDGAEEEYEEESTEAEEKNEPANMITYIDKVKLMRIAKVILKGNYIDWYSNNSIGDIIGYLDNNTNALVQTYEQRKSLCLTSDMMEDLPKRVNYVDGTPASACGSRSITSVSAIPHTITSVFGKVEYLLESDNTTVKSVRISLDPDKFEEKVGSLVCEGEEFDWDLYSQLLTGAPKGETLSENIDALVKINKEKKSASDLVITQELTHEGYDYYLEFASVILNPTGSKGYAAVDGSDASAMWKFFRNKGLTEVATAGVMGNIEQESGFSSTNLQNRYERELGYTDASYTAAVDNGTYTNFVHDNAAYGIAQFKWWSLKQELLVYARQKGTSIGDFEMQLNFLWETMTNGRYCTGLVEALNAAKSPGDAAYIFNSQYEKATSNPEMENRIAYAVSIYNQFKGMDISDNTGGTDTSGNTGGSTDTSDSGYLPIIGSQWDATRTGTLGSSTTCNTLSGDQITRIMESVGNVSSARKNLIRFALSKVGTMPYYWGAGHDGSYRGDLTVADCSGFVAYVLYHTVGIDTGGADTSTMRDYCIANASFCDASSLQPGDLIVRPGHVVIYLGMNRNGYVMVVDETGPAGSTYSGNVMYGQKGHEYFGSDSVFIHLNI